MEDKLLFNMSQAAKQLSISVPTLRRWLQEPGFPVIRIGGCVRIPKKQLEQWMEANLVTSGK